MVNKNRWRSGIGLEYFKELRKIILNGGAIKHSPFRKDQEYNDLGGIIFTEKFYDY